MYVRKKKQKEKLRIVRLRVETPFSRFNFFASFISTYAIRLFEKVSF